MTSFYNDPYTDLNARGRQMRRARDTAEAEVWKFTDLLPRWFVRMAPDPAKRTAKAERRTAVRRTDDTLPR